MKDYKLYVFDLDGVLYRGKEVVPGAQQTIKHLQDKGKLVRFLTNNSTQTRRHFADNLFSMGFDVRPESIYTSAVGAAIYLRNSSAYVVGEEGLREELLPEADRNREESLGYISRRGIPAPSVVSINGIAASIVVPS